MKRKAVLLSALKETKKKGEIFTVQVVENILVLNYWKDRILQGRYCMNWETGEYEYWDAGSGRWREAKLGTACQENPWRWRYGDIKERIRFDTPEDEAIIKEQLPRGNYGQDSVIDRIWDKENEYSNEKRENRALARQERLERLMRKVPPLPENFRRWVFEAEAPGEEYAFWDGEQKAYTCTACGKASKQADYTRQDGERKIRNNDWAICPACKKRVQVKKRVRSIARSTQVMLLQAMDERTSVSRHVDVKMTWALSGKSAVCSEAVRIILDKKGGKTKLYYSDMPKSWWCEDSGFQETNPQSRRIQPCFLYPEGISEALQGTFYGVWVQIFPQMAAAGKKLDYNGLMIASQREREIPRVVEYLFKGRFNRLLRETSGDISYYSGQYIGPLCLEGMTIEEVFGLSDRQKINRIRQCDGGKKTLEWMHWSENTGKRLDDEALKWLTQEEIREKDIKFISDRMSLAQIMNYVRRQQKESYAGKSTGSVLRQWDDYLQMCEKLMRHMDDEMVYRPRELKRRHDEAVEECRRRADELKLLEQEREANRMRDKYPGAEENLEEIRARYEYRNEKYIMKVPKRLIEIVREGAELHHCAGSSERYFERIMQRETYICFLRKAEEPDKAYYTIEVEPGGTIRQHRSYLDEEPDVDKIRGFLREWQKVIKKRLNEEDRELARISAQKRQKNIEELREKNNTRVLKGLEEDFMEAV